jgi:hypothetical protein
LSASREETPVLEETRASPQLNTDAAVALWKAFMEMLEATGEAVLRTSGKAGAGVASRLLTPLFRRTWKELQQNGALDATAEIARLSRLDEDWDADEGLAATPAARDLAHHVLARTLAAAYEAKVPWVRPAVSTSGDGGVDLFWSGAKSRALILIEAEADEDHLVRVSETRGAAPERALVPLSEVVQDVLQALRGA